MGNVINKLYLFVDFNQTYDDEGLEPYYVEIRDEKDATPKIIKYGADKNEVTRFAKQYKRKHSKISYIVNNVD